jgi:tetratricopeptide (TPR) repeat protein
MKVERTRRSKYALAGTVAVVTFLVYLAALGNDFVNWDDVRYVSENLHIRSLNGAFFKWALFDFYESNWHPLTWLSHAVDYAVWGLNPRGHHLTNIVLHAINTFAVVFLMTALLDAWRKRSPENERTSFLNERAILIAAGTTALLFGLHPVHVESVAWVAERKDLLCGLFFLLSLILYTKYAGDEGMNAPARAQFFNKYYLGTLGMFILALMSKPMAVSLPVVLLILDWHPFGRIASRKAMRSMIGEKIPFIALSLLSSLLTVLAQRSGEAIQTTEFAPLSGRLFVAAKSIVFYVWKIIWPLNLVPYYPYPEKQPLLSFQNLAAAVLVIGTTAACWIMAEKNKLWPSAWWYFLVTLLPVIGIIQVGGQAMADRYLYLPGLAPFLIVGLAAAWCAAKLPGAGRKGVTIAASGLVVVLLSFLTVRQIGIWKNSVTLWNYIVQQEPMAPRAYNNRGRAYENGGQFLRAIADYDKAIDLDPSFYDAYVNRGVAFAEIRRIDRAIRDFEAAIAVAPSEPDAYYRRGSAFEELGQPDKAMKDYDRAIDLNASYYLSYVNRGVLFGKAGLFDKAIEDFNRAIGINPSFADAYTGRGTAYALGGRYALALEDFNKAIELNDRFPLAYYNRGRLYLKTGQREAAVSDFEKACEMGSNDGCYERRQLAQPFPVK